MIRQKIEEERAPSGISGSRFQKIFILTGAGISAESGIPIFQGTSWRGHSHYELANIEAWERNPELVWRYYSDRRARASGAQPNAAHCALAEFEKAYRADSFFLCTQNVDGLHEGSGVEKHSPYSRQVV